MLGDIIKKDDFKNEKHVPVIECPDKVKAGEEFMVEVQVGKEIAHPNTVEHHIAWIDLFIHYDGDPNTVNLGRFEFGAVVGQPHVKHVIKLDKPGKLIALSYCNIHGLWESSKEIVVE
ncbi:class II SORL domain-containing protein [Oceanotoga sp. DSM 15011]|uniref:Superoxide reductase n=1 Tax=Oceanotoga teriensis TaxID=515440 RepID=A0AA45HI94_9BACT|nr:MULTISPECIES: class II SORL domain-containing protein [Oceanotoga]MDN5343736.1 superoxide reductase [Oceanotoga sp.]MDO7977419.1 class II SORL domain-containing protein [Oceanotoga teriensis]PWJ89629.1 superoxide reductase [Oceanotoga teriensis]UYO98898.1 class II SORL domain-containing protein [Oceanotoga sp. DSM 15011]